MMSATLVPRRDCGVNDAESIFGHAGRARDLVLERRIGIASRIRKNVVSRLRRST
jgi:hypothetical protein